MEACLASLGSERQVRSAADCSRKSSGPEGMRIEALSLTLQLSGYTAVDGGISVHIPCSPTTL